MVTSGVCADCLRLLSEPAVFAVEHCGVVLALCGPCAQLYSGPEAAAREMKRRADRIHERERRIAAIEARPSRGGDQP